MSTDNSSSKNLSTVFKEIVNDAGSLINEHIKLFKHEVSDNTNTIIKAGISLLIAALIAYAGLIFLGILLITVLSFIIPAFFALVLVTSIYIGVPLILLIYSLNLFNNVKNKQKKSIKELKKTKEEAKIWLRNLKK